MGAEAPTDEPPPTSVDIEQLARQLAHRFPAGGDSRTARQLLESALGLLADDPDPLDLKIAAAAMTEMREAFEIFHPYEEVPKVTVFGSARTRPDDPVYGQARDVAAALAARGWMVVTGAGPGIMQAAMEGAGRDRSIGVAIRLPFEQGANPVIAGDEKYVSMKYFFTRKLMLVKESSAFVCLPGGFGTLDETFELFTLTQTGKGMPVPIVLLDPPGDPFWRRIDDMIRELLVSRGLVSQHDVELYVVTDSVEQTCAEIDRFYANYHSIRYVGDQVVVRLRHEPTDALLAALDERFGDLLASGRFMRSGPLDIERRHGDHLDLPRLRFSFAKHRASGLRALIDRLNRDVAPMPSASRDRDSVVEGAAAAQSPPV
ncbi:MAG: TIGR00730 family Rossman fold protein [Ilumatobacteraceae bacterium]